MRGEEGGRGTVKRYHTLTWPYEIKTEWRSVRY
jgi:hypothetical protein